MNHCRRLMTFGGFYAYPNFEIVAPITCSKRLKTDETANSDVFELCRHTVHKILFILYYAGRRRWKREGWCTHRRVRSCVRVRVYNNTHTNVRKTQYRPSPEHRWSDLNRRRGTICKQHARLSCITYLWLIKVRSARIYVTRTINMRILYAGGGGNRLGFGAGTTRSS